MALAVAVAEADHLHQVLIVHSSPAFSAATRDMEELYAISL